MMRYHDDTGWKSCAPTAIAKQFMPDPLSCGVRAMNKSSAGCDYDRYRKLLADANDEPKRLALIQLLFEERAKDRLAQHSLGSSRAALASPAELARKAKAEVRPLKILTLGANFLSKRIAQADRPVEHRTSRR
jgi:hypothetical protein